MSTTSTMSRRLARLEAAEQPPTAYFWAGPETEAEIAALPPGTRAVVYRWAEKGEVTLPEMREPGSAERAGPLRVPPEGFPLRP